MLSMIHRRPNGRPLTPARARTVGNQTIPPIEVPAWRLSLTTNWQWSQLSGTRPDTAMAGYSAPGGLKGGICAYSGMTVLRNALVLGGGGHNDYAGNDLLRCDLLQSSPAFAALRNPTGTVAQGVSHYADGRPSSPHSYWNLQAVDALNQIVYIGRADVWNLAGGVHFENVDAFDIATNDWLAANTYASGPAGFVTSGIGICKDSNEDVWVFEPFGSGNIRKWSWGTKTWSLIGTGSVYDINMPFCHDPVRNRIVRFGGAQSSRYDLNNNAAQASVTFSGTHASRAATSASVVWCDDTGTFLLWRWDENAVYEVNPDTFEVTLRSVSGTAPTIPPADGTRNLYGRFAYLKDLKLLVYVRSISDDIWVCPTGTI